MGRRTVRLLYRALKPEDTTIPTLFTEILPLLLRIQHWAVEVISSSGRAWRFELQYNAKINRNTLRETGPDDNSDRDTYLPWPSRQRWIVEGKTSLSIREIREIANEIISEMPKYRLGVTDCRKFATTLLHEAIDNPTIMLGLKKMTEDSLGRLLHPLSVPLSGLLKNFGTID